MVTPDGRAELLNAIYERIVVRGPEFVSARLTPDIWAMGLALAARTRPSRARVGTGAPDGVGSALTAYDMPIEGRDEWLAAAARHFA